MAKRFSMGRQASKRSFTRGASRTHAKNLGGSSMRGGIRL